jgi:MIP family channel proteins
VLERPVAAYVAELIGTFLLVFAIGIILTVNSTSGLGYADFAVIGLVHAFMLMMLIHTLGATSGGHFNPAVTAALLVVRKIQPIHAAVYWTVQFAGAILAALAVKGVLTVQGKAVNYGAPNVSQQYLHGHTFVAFVVEGIGAFILIWAIMGVAINRQARADWAGFVIGASLGLAVMMFGPLTGAGFNPARALGPALVSNHWANGASFIVIYVLGPIVGGILAAVGYTALVPEQPPAAGVPAS